MVYDLQSCNIQVNLLSLKSRFCNRHLPRLRFDQHEGGDKISKSLARRRRVLEDLFAALLQLLLEGLSKLRRLRREPLLVLRPCNVTGSIRFALKEASFLPSDAVHDIILA